MKFNYYGYHIQEVNTGNKYLFSINDFLTSFCEYNNAVFKNSFKLGSKNYYLLNISDKVFLFLQTNNADLIKKIDNSNISVSELSDILNRNEKIAFGAYIYIDDKYLGIASPALSPKISSFTTFVNMIFAYFNNEYTFNVTALLQYATRSEVMQLPFIGKSTIQVSRQNGLFESLKGLAGLDDNDILTLGSIEITFKPKIRRNIKNAVLKLMGKTTDNDLNKMLISGKEDLNGHLIDYFIEGSGVIHDIINSKNEKDIFKIIDVAKSNIPLKEELKKYESDESFEKNCATINSLFCGDVNWAAVVGDLQDSSISKPD